MPPTGNQIFLVGHAKGVQIYTCDGAKWVLPSIPRADLVDDAGKLIVKHSGGPTWTATADGSTVTAKAIAKDPADPLPADAMNFQQLLLQATPTPAACWAARRSSSGSTPRAGPNLPPPSARRKRPAR